tara:strand:+ start:2301 stop:2813 length:513 start_codon:yes stop_codon:yes gene_type:complete
LKKLGNILIIGAIISVGAFVYHYAELISKLVYNISNIRFRFFGNDGQIEFDADLVIENKGLLRNKIYETEVNFSINDLFIARVVSLQEYVLEPKSYTTIPVVVAANTSTSFQNVKQVLQSINYIPSSQNIDSLRITFSGKLKVKIFGIFVRVPFSYTDTIGNLKSNNLNT